MYIYIDNDEQPVTLLSLVLHDRMHVTKRARDVSKCIAEGGNCVGSALL